MKSRKIFLVAFALMLLCVFKFFPTSLGADAMAQDSEVKEGNISLPDKRVLVATVNIYDSKIVSQENSNLKLSFDLSNREYVQPDIRYMVQLVREDEDGNQIIIDEKLYSEVVSLGENKTIKKEIEYNAPEYLSGEFQLWIIARNENGLPLALSNLGKITLMGSEQFIEFLNDTCYLKVSGDESINYAIGQGVDINSEESLVAVCNVVNRFNSEVTLSPEIKTFWRTSFGSEVETKKESDEKYVLKANEKKQLSFILPKPSVPQAYDAQLKLKNNQGEIVSNSVNFHYVISGLSATIQNLRLDKNYYQKGETAKASFYWSGSADNFMGARLSPTENGKLFVNMAILDSKNRECVDEMKKELDSSVTTPEFNLNMERECVNPRIVVSIQDDKGNILNKKDFKLESSNVAINYKNQNLIFSYVIIFIIVLMLASWIVILLKKGTGNASKLFFVIICGGIFLSSGDAKADTFVGSYDVSSQFSSSFHNLDYVLTANVNKLNYFTGESMNGSVMINSVSCMNSLTDYNLTVSLRPGHSETLTRGISTGNGVLYNSSWTRYSNAPGTVGDYNAYFTFKDNRCFANSGGCLSAITNYGSIYFNNELYAANKTSHLNSIKFDGRDDWTDAQTKALCISMSGSLYNHYIQYGKAEGVSSCKMNCNSSAGNLDDANHAWPVAYSVVPGELFVNGACGTRNNVIYPANVWSWPNVWWSTFCSSGTVTPSNPAFPAPGAVANWVCSGSGGGTSANCQTGVRETDFGKVPVLNFWATPNSIPVYDGTTLNWTTSNVATCTALSYWSGSKDPTGGSEFISNIGYSRYFAMECWSASGATTGRKEAYVGVVWPTADGACGTNSSAIPYPALTTAWPSTSNVAFCKEGNPSPSAGSIQFPPQGVAVSWRCTGVSGGSSIDCSASRVLANPQVNFWADSAPLVYLNDGFNVQSEKSVKLNWDIINSGDACSCGYGCSCTLYDKDGNIVAEKPYDAADSSYVNVGMGSNEFKLVCVNQNLVESEALVSLTGTCLETDWDIDTGCSVACGGGELYKRRIKTDCDLEKIKIGDCNPEPCPVGSEIREVNP